MAAGLGFKTFTTGEVLTAADVNGYLMQGILVFANAAARSSAITSPQEGQYSFLKDTNALEYYDGAAWVGAPVGDITSVTAGTGISGGGTSGTVTITNDMATTITASGDIVVGTGSGTYDNLPIGTTGQVLTADTTVSPYKVKWATAAAGGKVLQVVSSTITTSVNIATTTMTDTNITASITPSATSSKILILIAAMAEQNRNSNGITSKGQLFRGATSIQNYDNYYMGISAGGATSVRLQVITGLSYLDSPSTTSSVTYKLQANCNDTANSGSITFQRDGAPSNITLLEIGA